MQRYFLQLFATHVTFHYLSSENERMDGEDGDILNMNCVEK